MSNGKNRTYVDFEFDGTHHKPISMALINSDGKTLHVALTDTDFVKDPWVLEHVMPVLDSCPLHELERPAARRELDSRISEYFDEDRNPHLVMDYQSDIIIFCELMIIGPGQSNPTFDGATFEFTREDAYPTTVHGAVQHCAMWDAIALRDKVEGDGLSYKINNILFIRKSVWENNAIHLGHHEFDIEGVTEVAVIIEENLSATYMLKEYLANNTYVKDAIGQILKDSENAFGQETPAENAILKLDKPTRPTTISDAFGRGYTVLYSEFGTGVKLYLVKRGIGHEGIRRQNYDIYYVNREFDNEVTTVRSLVEQLRDNEALILTNDFAHAVENFIQVQRQECERENYQELVMNPKVSLDYTQSQAIDEFIDVDAGIPDRATFVNKAVDAYMKSLKEKE